MSAIGFDAHNHARCIADTLRAADGLCADRGLQFTPVRRRVLEILLERHRALGAYDILEVLAAEGLGAQPPVAYRALDFLLAHGLVHKIESRNAFIACTHPHEGRPAAMLVCEKCGLVTELDASDALSSLEAAAAAQGFTLHRSVVELTGICAACAKGA